MKYLNFVIIFFSTTLCSLEKESDSIKNYIEENLPLYGTLIQNVWGGVYVKVDDQYIDKLFNFIEDSGFKKPNFEQKGAHITVINAIECRIEDIEEIGLTIPFKFKSCEIVQPKTWSNMKKVYIVTVEAPILDALRQKYGFSTYPYDYHITIGVIPKEPEESVFLNKVKVKDHYIDDLIMGLDPRGTLHVE